MMKRPPKLATRLLNAFIKGEIREEVLGDLDESFRRQSLRGSYTRAAVRYWYEVFNYLRPFAIRKMKSERKDRLGMMQSYSKVAFRSLLKQKLYSGLNVFGLAVGVSAFVMIALFVQYEYAYDRFLPDADRVYNVYQHQQGNAYIGSEYFAVTPLQLADAMRSDLPEVEHTTRVYSLQSMLRSDSKTFWESGIATDENFFHVFHYGLLQGDVQHLLAQPNSIVLTQSLARKIFGDDEVVGRQITFGDKQKLITGVAADVPENSTLQFSYLVNMRSDDNNIEEFSRSRWQNNSVHTFFTVRNAADASAIEEKFPAMIRQYQDPEAYKNYPFRDTYHTRPLVDIHLMTNINFDPGLKGSKTYIYVLAGVGLLVLFLACINYINLAIARSMRRAREVGLRKVVGALKQQLVFQFLGEAVLISFVSVMLALVFSVLMLPQFSVLVERALTLDFVANPSLFPALLIVVLFVGVVSGSYPAFFISSLVPASVMSGKISSPKKLTPQRFLVVVQFCVSIVLVTSSIVIYEQMQFVRTSDTGIDREHVLVMDISDRTLFEHYDVLKAQWLQLPGVVGVTSSGHLPTNIRSSTILNNNDSDKSNDIAIYTSDVASDYFSVFGLHIIAGHDFQPAGKVDQSKSILINEKAAKALGWTAEEAIGKQVSHQDIQSTIIGVVRDFHLHSLHVPVEPVLFSSYQPHYGSISVKVRPDKLAETVEHILKAARGMSAYPLDYGFLDDKFTYMYREDMRVGETFRFFTLLSVTIAALGLFGLAAFVSGQRTKEIGVRKVLGASVQSIVLLVSKDFLKLIGIAFLISVPVAWYVMHEWLLRFTFRIQLQWWMFAVSGVIALLIANLSIGYQSFRASVNNPVKSLRS